MGATQDLQQKVCQKYGWSYHYDTDENGHFFVDIVVGININNRYRFISTTTATTQREMLHAHTHARRSQ